MSDKVLVPTGIGDSRSLSSLLDNTVISQEIFNSTHTHCKVITSGKIVEVYEYEGIVKFGPKSVFERRFISDDDDVEITKNPDRVMLGPKPDRSLEYKKRNVSRAKNRVRRLVQNNFSQVGKLLTLTFRDTGRFDITSLNECLSRFQYFTKVLRSYSPYVRYVATPEFQDANGRGAVHYHLITDLDFIPIEELRKLWRYGFVKINQIHNPACVGIYIAKYFTKASLDERFAGHRTFYTSLNLRQPQTRYGDKYLDLPKRLKEMGYLPTYKNTYFSPWCGNINYSSYNLYQTPNLPVQESNNE